MKISLFATGVVLAALISSCANNEAKNAEPVKSVLSQPELQLRGKYLVNAIGCDDCHSPKKMGPNGPEIIEDLRFSGYPSSRESQTIDKENLNRGWILFNNDLTSSVGPWGQSFAANISSDATGIGNWTEQNFMLALREGKYKGLAGSRNLLPPMPWPIYANLSDEDIRAIFAFLKSSKPVNNVVPAPMAPGG